LDPILTQFLFRRAFRWPYGWTKISTVPLRSGGSTKISTVPPWSGGWTKISGVPVWSGGWTKISTVPLWSGGRTKIAAVRTWSGDWTKVAAVRMRSNGRTRSAGARMWSSGWTGCRGVRNWSSHRTNAGTFWAVTVTDSELKRLGPVEWLDQIRRQAGLVRPLDREEKITIDTYCPRACPSATGPARHEP